MKMNDSNAVAALLMLDVASAKSTLSQLQFHCTAAFKEHQQLRDQLQDLQKGHLLPGLSQSKDANPSSTNACQHLQALRLENLQLKAMLKAEVEARQLVEQQNAALAQLIRTLNIGEMLAATEDLDADSCPTQITQQHNAMQAECTTNLLHSQDASGSGSNHAPAGSIQEAPTATTPAACQLSAFFPHQQHEVTAGRSAQANRQCPVVLSKAIMSVGHGRQVLQTADTSQAFMQHQQHCKLPNTERMQQQEVIASLQEQQQQQQQPGDSGCTDSGVPAAVGVTSSEPSVSCSSSPGSLQLSRRSDLLDSDDLEELAGLCDVLVAHRQQHQATCHQQDQHQHPSGSTCQAALAAMPQAHVAHDDMTSSPPSATKSRQQQSQQQWQEQCWQHLELHTTSSTLTAAHQYTLQQPSQRETMKSPNHSQVQQQSDKPLLGLAVIAAQLQHLQHQLASPGHDSKQGEPASAHTPTVLQSSPLPSAEGNVSGGEANSNDGAVASSSIFGSNNNSSACIPGRLASQNNITGAAVAGSSRMAGLQQQLEQRMSEMKQRLSNICNGMLHEAASTSITASSQINSSATQCHIQHTLSAAAMRRWQVPAAAEAMNGAAAVQADISARSHQQPNRRSPPSTVKAAAADLGCSSRLPTLTVTSMKGKAVQLGDSPDEQPQLIAAVRLSTASQQQAITAATSSTAGGTAGVRGCVDQAESLSHVQQEARTPAMHLTAGRPAFAAKANAHSEDGHSSGSSWATVEDEEDEQEQQLQQLEGTPHHPWQQQQQLHPVRQGLISPPDSIGSPVTKLDMCTSVSEQHMRTPGPPGPQPRACGASCGSSCSSDSRSSCGSPTASCLQHDGSPWLQTQLNIHGASSGVQGVVPGMQGRRAAEVAQTVSPLKQFPAVWHTHPMFGDPVQPGASHKL